MAAGISGCALGEMSDGRIEVLVEERDAVIRDIERERGWCWWGGGCKGYQKKENRKG